MLKAKAQLESARAELEKARSDLSHTVILAPSHGGITKLKIDVGHYAN